MPSADPAATVPDGAGYIYLQYVVHARVAEFEARGWRVLKTPRPTHHDFHAVIMIWDRPGAPEGEG
ncbi:MAG: hypothetical protein NW216_07680 [Hyphomicrobium sp.]|nr:hypothetical protein [Hyphomicrobium sp.]